MHTTTRQAGRHPFRSGGGHDKVYRLHGWERALLVTLIAQFIFLPWALGGMRLWAQLISAGIAVVGFVIALLPRNYTAAHSPSGPLRHYPHRRLLRFPLFWFGLLLFGYIVIQGINPAWEKVALPGLWFMMDLPHKAWLPHGTLVPFADGGQWRELMLVGTAWLTACALWIGITRRKSLRIMLAWICTSAVLLCLLAIIQRLTGTNRIFWIMESPNQIWGSFIYRNHGAAWFNLMVPIFFGLAALYYVKALRRLAKSSPAPVFAFLGLLMSVGVLASYSRGGVIALLIFCALFLIAFLIRQATLPDYPRKNLISSCLAALFVLFTVIGWRGLDVQTTWDRFERFFKAGETSRESRRLATVATLEMWEASPWSGHGAGSFRFIFPRYQQNHPEIFKLGQSRLFWEYAHNDMVQALAEYGVLGSALLLGILGWGLAAFLRRKAWLNPLSLSLLLGLAATLCHSWGEFVLHCPAILVTWAGLGIFALRWAELDPPSIPGTGNTPERSP